MGPPILDVWGSTLGAVLGLRQFVSALRAVRAFGGLLRAVEGLEHVTALAGGVVAKTVR